MQCIVSPGNVSIAGSTIVTRGDDVSFLCSSSGGPGNSYQWLMNDALLPDENGALLVLLQVNSTHGGDYTCKVTNAAGTTISTLTLYIEPYITTFPETELEVERTDAAMFICTADGFPFPNVTWWKIEGYGVNPGMNISVSVNGNLSFVAVTHVDSGTYICEASAMTSSGVQLQSVITQESVLIGKN